MSLHLIKLCVGVDDVDHLIGLQQSRLADARAQGEPQVLRHVTRNMPRRRDEILPGGSLYWVIRRVICVRQPIVDLVSVRRPDGRSACAIILAPRWLRTAPRRHRPFQGWRYFPAADVPPDVSSATAAASANLPGDMAEELRDLGLL
jgi:hypothetical protein